LLHHFRRAFALLAAVVAVAGLAVAGCSSSPRAGSSSTTTTPNRSFTIETPEGTLSLSLDGQLPPHWPSDFPVPPGATPAGSGSIGNETTAHMIGVFQTTASGQDTFNFYRNSSSLTVSNPKTVGVGNSFVGRLEFSGTHHGSVTVADVNGETHIVVYLNTSTAKPSPVSGDR
jgi:hypothetical protein